MAYQNVSPQFQMDVSELYSEYERDFISSCEQLQAIENPSQNLQKYERLISDLITTQKQLDVELCALPSQLRSEFNKKLKPYKKILQKSKSLLQTLSLTQNTKPQSEVNLQSEFSINDRLSESKRLLFQTQAISDTIQVNLSEQTNKMKGMTDKTKLVGKIVGQAEEIVQRLWIKEQKNRLVLGTVLVIVGGIIFYMH